ncbi:MAG: hypothetical protein WCC69_13450 [Pirellulales bacterium]
MDRRYVSVAFVLMLGLTAASPTAGLAADPPAMARSSIPTLADRLKTGLRVQAPADVAFCNAVAAHVRTGRLPGPLVDSTFFWATQRGKKYPFPAFAHVMRIKAAKLGVSLDQPAARP